MKSIVFTFCFRLLAIGFCCLLTSEASAITYTFSGTGNWEDGGNWSPSYPNTNIASGDVAIIAFGAVCTIPGTSTINIQGTLTIDGTLNIASSGTLSNLIGGNITNNGTLTVSGFLGNEALISNASSLTIASGGNYTTYSGGSLTNSSVLTIATGGSIIHSSSLALANSGTLSIHADGALSLYIGSLLTNSGTLSNSGTFISHGIVSNTNILHNNGAMAVNDGTLTNTGTLNNNSLLNNNNGHLTNSNILNNNSGGTLNNYTFLTNNGTFTNFSGGILNNEGLFNNNASLTNNAGGNLTNSSALNNNAGGNLTNSGAMTANGTLNNYENLTNTSNLTIPSGGRINNNSGGILNNLVTLTINTGGVLHNLSGATLNNGNLQNKTATLTTSGLLYCFGGNLNNFATLTNTADGDLTINSGALTNTDGATLTNNGSMTNDATLTNLFGAIFNNNGTLNNRATGTFTNSGTLSNTSPGAFAFINSGALVNNTGGTLTNSGTLTNLNGSVTNSGTLTNPGTYTGFGTFSGSLFTNPVGGTVASTGGCLTFANGFTNEGTLQMQINGVNQPCGSFGQLVVTGTATVGGILSVTFGYVPDNGQTFQIILADVYAGTFSTLLVPSGNYEISYLNGLLTVLSRNYIFTGTANWTNPANWTPTYPGTGGTPNGDKVMIATGAACTIPSGTNVHLTGITTITGTLANNGTITNHNAITNNGTLTNSGAYAGSGTFAGSLFSNLSGGTVTPGVSPGCQTFSNGFTNAGTLSIEINGATACTQFDQLSVTGASTAGGILSLNFGFVPSIGQTFQIITASSYPGTFSSISATPAAYSVSYLNGLLTVTGITYTFTGTGDWTNPGNWSPGYPGLSIASGNTAIIAVGAVCGIPSSTAVLLNGALTINGTLSNNVGATLTNNGTLTNGGTLNNHGTYQGTGTFGGSLFTNLSVGMVAPGASPGCLTFSNGFTNAGTLSMEINGAAPCTQFDQLSVTGAATAGGTLSLNFGFLPTNGQAFQIISAGSYPGTFPTISATPGSYGVSYLNGLLTFTGRTYTFTGTGNWTNPGNWSPSYPGLSIASGDVAIIASGAVCTIPGATTVTIGGALTIIGTLTNSGILTNNAAVTNSGTLNNGGTLNNSSTLSNSGTLTNSGTLANTAAITNSGTFTNNGTYSGTGTFGGSLFTNPPAGTVAPGASPGCLTFSNGFTNAGTLSIEINGTTACTQFDRIVVTGTVTVGGALFLNFGFVPTNGQTFQIITAGAYAGTFSSISATPNSYGVSYLNGLLTFTGITYTFTGTGDWTTPGNWSPSYPGLSIASGNMALIAFGAVCTIPGATTVNVAVGGSLSNEGTLDNNGTVTNGGFVTNQNIGDLTNDGTFTNNGSLTNLSFNFVISNAAIFNNAGTLTNTSAGPPGRITISAGGTFANLLGSLLESGMFTLIENCGTFTNAGIINSSGTITNCPASTVTITATGIISCTSAITGGTVVNHGGIVVGCSPGIMAIDGSFTTDGSLSMELGGLTAGTGAGFHDQLQVSGAVTFGGTLTVSLFGGFTPVPTNAFTLMTYGSRTGMSAFATLSIPCPSCWSLSYGATALVLTLNSALPVELTSFHARPDGNSVLLDWHTASESDNRGFEIQRSENIRDWKALGWVNGQGSSTAEHDYFFRDDQPLPGNNYYRLRQVDFSEAANYSPVVQVEMHGERLRLEVLPNPNSGSFTLQIQLENRLPWNAALLSADGRTVWEQSGTGEEGGISLEPVLENPLASGIYFVKVETSLGQVVKRMVVQE